jgi:hypothetical protein
VAREARTKTVQAAAQATARCRKGMSLIKVALQSSCGAAQPTGLDGG